MCQVALAVADESLRPTVPEDAPVDVQVGGGAGGRKPDRGK